MNQILKKCFFVLAITFLMVGCGNQNEHLAKGKELIKSDKRRKEERAVREFKLAIEQDKDNAEAHYLLGFYDSQEFYEANQPNWDQASIAQRGQHMFKAYQQKPREYLEILVFDTLRDDDAHVQNAALEALTLVYQMDGRKQLLKQLEKAIKSKDNRDRHDAQWVMANIGKTDPTTMVPILIELLNHKQLGTRLNAVKALGEIGSETAIPELAALVESGSAKRKRDREVAEVRQLAVAALGKIGGKAVPELVKITQNKGSSLRVDAIRALSALGDEKAVQPLLDALKEKSSREIIVELGN